MADRQSLEAEAKALVERASHEWPRPAPEESLAHLPVVHRKKWRKLERVTIEGDFDTFVAWIGLRDYEYKHTYSLDPNNKLQFARMYFSLVQHIESIRDGTCLFSNDTLPPELANMQVNLFHEIAAVNAKYRAEWFRIRWGESIENYRAAVNRPTSSCLVAMIALIAAATAVGTTLCLLLLTLSS